MKVGDLVKFRDNGAVGLGITVMRRPDDVNAFRIQWRDGVTNVRFCEGLELISANR